MLPQYTKAPNTALIILEAIECSGELSLAEIAELIPKKFHDHRDFYIFASLVSVEFIDDDRLPDNDKPNPNRHKEQLLAREYFACSTAGNSAKHENHTWMRPGKGNSLKDQKFAISGKGSLFLSEYRTKRSDRIFTLATGILIGIIVAIISAYFRSIITT